MGDLVKALKHAAEKPESVTAGDVTVRRRPLTEQIEATKFLMATRARSRGGMAGVSITKLKPHGAILPAGPDLRPWEWGG
ncbi:MAG: hypothetical protein ABSA67_10255 [Candidatus Brocadiia bacterium]|jgi:hypothetical protein